MRMKNFEEHIKISNIFFMDLKFYDSLFFFNFLTKSLYIIKVELLNKLLMIQQKI